MLSLSAKLALHAKQRRKSDEVPCSSLSRPWPLQEGQRSQDLSRQWRKDKAEFDTLVANGWFASYDEAVAGKKAEAIVEAAEAFEESVDEVSGPTREELEQKAEELGVKFNKRTTNRKLAERIAEALEG